MERGHSCPSGIANEVSCFEVEHIIIDGGSTDGTADALRAWENERSTFNIERPTLNKEPNSLIPQFPNSPINYFMKWVSEPDQGLYDALNKGLKMATGDVIGILHTDDVWEPGVLERVSDAFRREASLECGSLLPPSGASGLPDGGKACHAERVVEDGPAGASSASPKAEASFRTPGASIDAVYGDLLYVDADDITKVRRVWKSGNYDPKKWFNGWMPPHPALFVTRELVERVGDYRLDLGSAADKGFLKSVKHNCI